MGNGWRSEECTHTYYAAETAIQQYMIRKCEKTIKWSGRGLPCLSLPLPFGEPRLLECLLRRKYGGVCLPKAVRPAEAETPLGYLPFHVPQKFSEIST